MGFGPSETRRGCKSIPRFRLHAELRNHHDPFKSARFEPELLRFHVTLHSMAALNLRRYTPKGAAETQFWWFSDPARLQAWYDCVTHPDSTEVKTWEVPRDDGIAPCLISTRTKSQEYPKINLHAAGLHMYTQAYNVVVAYKIFHSVGQDPDAAMERWSLKSAVGDKHVVSHDCHNKFCVEISHLSLIPEQLNHRKSKVQCPGMIVCAHCHVSFDTCVHTPSCICQTVLACSECQALMK
eukprot:c3540_g1_i1.p1 GENE.c3540_g1_i1~~c3540_g1_i1.p1  ORF type:complete len:239 (-),score=6.18 c3540_g1_i1:30-746(-)